MCYQPITTGSVKNKGKKVVEGLLLSSAGAGCELCFAYACIVGVPCSCACVCV